MFDPLEFLDPILHILNFFFQALGIAESLFKWLFANHEELRNLGLLLAAIIGLPLLIWRGVSLDRSSKAAQKQAENAQMQAENVSKSHVADTYTRAIEQLGAVDSKGEPNLELRLGGLYALEKIAKANEDYHPQIMEVLCAYVRMHCQNDFDPEEDDSEQHFEPLGIDIHACLTVIGRREVSFDKIPLDLIGVQLIGANLRNGSFVKADLTKANLSKTDLTEANFSQADFLGANLSEAILIRAKFNGTDLKFANLREAHFNKADLSGAKNLTCKQIKSANIDRQTILPDYINIT